jgi:hypothetical protein
LWVLDLELQFIGYLPCVLTSSWKLLRNRLCQFKTNEEPEEVTCLCDVIGNVITDFVPGFIGYTPGGVYNHL